MVILTERAAAAIHDLTEQPDAPDGAGLRIATDVTRGSLNLSLAATPSAGDAVVEAAGARLFLDPDAALVLNDKALDVGTGADGQMTFTVAEQSG
ncbi:HesB/IscA family protein [Dactylosporangium sp. McL0621]|uniref:HesB/IscA family protein n=1 Tax=Dactylosporangium sp. McL0621 TaxID=3415678 RepID=UPI003CF33158